VAQPTTPGQPTGGDLLADPEAFFAGLPLEGEEYEPLGDLPPDYTAQRPLTTIQGPFLDRSGTTPIGAEQFPGQRFFTEEDVVRFLGQSPETIKRTQIAMSQAGILPASFLAGVPDDATKTAVRMVFTTANRAGYTSFKEALDFIGKANKETKELLAGLGLGGPQRPAPEDVRKAIDSAAVQELGRELDHDETQAMVDAYTKVYVERQGPEGFTTQPPSVAAFAEEQIGGGAHSTEAAAYQMAQRVQDFYQQLEGPIGAPSPTGGTF
jgi:hypothetical protein